MASQVLSNAKLYVGAYDLSGDINALALKYSAEMRDATTLSDTTRQRRAGLRDVQFQHEGFWNGGLAAVDDVLFNSALAVNDVPMTIGPLTGAEGELAYTFLGDTAQYAPGAKIGDMLGFSVSGGGDGPLVRGTMAHNASRSSTGTGTIMNLGAVGAAQKLYATLHVLAYSGLTNAVIKVQSAALVGFGTPTDRITFTTVAGVTSQRAAPVSGAITDAFWRVTWTLTGVGSLQFAVPVGIQ